MHFRICVLRRLQHPVQLPEVEAVLRLAQEWIEFPLAPVMELPKVEAPSLVQVDSILTLLAEQ